MLYENPYSLLYDLPGNFRQYEILTKSTENRQSAKAVCQSFQQGRERQLLGVPVRQGHLSYWAVQAGLVTPLTFARHRLSFLAAFTSGAYFLHNGRR